MDTLSGTACDERGTFTVTGGGDMTANNASIANAQTITVNTFSLTELN